MTRSSSRGSSDGLGFLVVHLLAEQLARSSSTPGASRGGPSRSLRRPLGDVHGPGSTTATVGRPNTMWGDGAAPVGR